MIKQNKYLLFLYFIALNLPLNFVRSDVFLSRSDDLKGAVIPGASTTFAPSSSKSSPEALAPAASSAPTTIEPASRHEHLQLLKDVKLSSVETTIAPLVHHLDGSGGSAALPPIAAAPIHHLATHLTTDAPIVGVHHTIAHITDAPVIVPVHHSVLVHSTEAPVAVVHHPTSHVTIAPAVHADGHAINDPLHKFCDYLRPICDSVDKIQAKQLTKIQGELRHFISLTSGKLGPCFFEHFNFDPTSKSLTLPDVKTICSSKKLPPLAKQSYKAFEGCAVKNWDAALDKELDKINEARANFLKNHNHQKDEAHDDDMALISEVIGQVLNSDKSVVNNSDIKVIDINGSSSKAVTPTSAPSTGSRSGIASTVKTPVAPNKVSNIMNDPNTLVVFVDDSKTTIAPAHLVAPVTKDAVLVPHTTVKAILPAVGPTSPGTNHPGGHVSIPPTGKQLNVPGQPITTAAPTAKAKEVAKEAVKALAKDPIKAKEVAKEAVIESKVPSLARKILPSVAPSSAPVEKLIHSSAVPSILSTHPVEAATTVKPLIVALTTKKTIVSIGSTKAAVIAADLKPSVKALLTTAKPNLLPVKVAKLGVSSVAPKAAAKPLEALEEILKRQEKEKQDLENKLRLEREKVLKQLKKQDEADAQSAIKALQIQRDATSSQASDAKLHQLEHDRQMSLDPVGHQIKHQQYELSKQQRLMGSKL